MIRVYTVKDLMERLAKLPPETEIHLMQYRGEGPWREDTDFDPFLVWEKDGEIRFYIDHGESFYRSVEAYSCSFMTDGAAWGRIENGVNK